MLIWGQRKALRVRCQRCSKETRTVWVVLPENLICRRGAWPGNPVAKWFLCVNGATDACFRVGSCGKLHLRRTKRPQFEGAGWAPIGSRSSRHSLVKVRIKLVSHVCKKGLLCSISEIWYSRKVVLNWITFVSLKPAPSLTTRALQKRISLIARTIHRSELDRWRIIHSPRPHDNVAACS